MMNVGGTSITFRSWWDKPATRVGKEALKKAESAESNSVLRKYIKANDYGDIYYELEGGQKCYSREDAIREIGKNLIDYIR